MNVWWVKTKKKQLTNRKPNIDLLPSMRRSWMDRSKIGSLSLTMWQLYPSLSLWPHINLNIFSANFSAVYLCDMLAQLTLDFGLRHANNNGRVVAE